MTHVPYTPRLTELAEVLLYERQLLEFLLFKMVSANLVLSADDPRFVTPAVAEVGRVMEEVRRVEEQRDLVIAALACEWATRVGDISLEYLANNAPEALRSTFADHWEAFLDLVGEIEQLTQENRKLATANDATGIDTSIGEVDASLETVLGSLTTLGAAANRIESAEIRNAEEMMSTRTRLSEIEDFDLAEAVMEMQLQECAHQAALAAFSRATQPSLVDFLR